MRDYTGFIGNVRSLPALPLAITLPAAIDTFKAGYDAYFNRRGPGVGRLRSLGWLQAHRDETNEIEMRQEERRSQF